MSSLRMIAVGAALALFVYVGATATDAKVGTVMTAVHTVLDADEPLEWFGEILIFSEDPAIVRMAVGLAFVVVFLGGLPLAVFGLLNEYQWRDVASGARPHLRVPYALLTLQIVSVLLSGFVLAVMAPSFLETSAMNRGRFGDWFLPGYLAFQFLAGIAAIPVWRLHMLNTSTEAILRTSNGFPSSG